MVQAVRFFSGREVFSSPSPVTQVAPGDTISPPPLPGFSTGATSPFKIMTHDTFSRTHHIQFGFEGDIPLNQVPNVHAQLLSQMNNGKKLLMMFDVDGTLIGDRRTIADAPSSPMDRANLHTLAHMPNVQVAIITARRVEQILKIFPELRDTNAMIVGMLNAEAYDCATGRWLKRENPDERAQIKLAHDSLVRRGLLNAEPEEVNELFFSTPQHPDVYLENKGITMCLHYKDHPDAPIVQAFRELPELIKKQYPNAAFQVIESGNKMLELVPSHLSKAEGVQMVYDRFAKGKEDEFYPVYLGDSLASDGLAFDQTRKLNGTSIFVKSWPPDAGLPNNVDYIVPHHNAVHALIAKLVHAQRDGAN